MFAEKSISRIVILHLIAIFFAIFNISDIKIGGLTKVIPLFDLMIVFYFAVFRNVFSIWFIFLLGMWNDALSGNPLGLTALLYIMMIKFFIALNNKLMIRENFRQIWQQFIVLCLIFLMFKWAFLSLYNGAFYSLKIILLQLILTSSFYVVMHRFFDYLHKKLIEEKY